MRLCALCFLSLILFLVVSDAVGASEPVVERHAVVYGEEGMFAGWPANHGMWMWGNEVLVGFSTGIHKDLGEERHNIDREKPEHHVLARSRDGGVTWQMEYPAERGMLINKGGMRHGITDPKHTEPEPVAITDPIQFTHPDFCMTMRFEHVHGGNSRLYYSYDRGKNWKGPFQVPSFGQAGVMARTDYIVNGPHDCHVFLTASKSNGKEGRIFCGRTADGGRNWKFLSYVGPEPSGFAIMPSTVRLSPDELVMTIRRREGPGERRQRWIETWNSTDNGKSWEYLNKAVEDVGEGNPPSLIQLRDGRLCLTYGVRKAPFEIQAKFSSDGGRTWTAPFILQTEGGGRDIGYPRSLERPDGKIVTVYYFHTRDNPYRRIVATIWDPGSAQDRVFTEIRRFDAPEARQGVAVDADHFYVITNQAIAKYHKTTGRFVTRWEASEERPLVHLNAGLVLNGKLYCAHSTYPAFPWTSSVEIWDAETLEHVDTHSFGITDGSLTWIDRHNGAWWAVFAHYSKRVGEDGRTKGTNWTRLDRLDAQWRRRESWMFPEEAVKRFEPSSNSGGAWGADGRLYCTGHDAPEIYTFTLPKAGSVLRMHETIPININGQAFAWDPTERDVIYGIDRQNRQVVVSRLHCALER